MLYVALHPDANIANASCSSFEALKPLGRRCNMLVFNVAVFTLEGVSISEFVRTGDTGCQIRPTGYFDPKFMALFRLLSRLPHEDLLFVNDTFAESEQNRLTSSSIFASAKAILLA
jgi:hypothetical protein